MKNNSSFTAQAVVIMITVVKNKRKKKEKEKNISVLQDSIPGELRRI